MQAKLLDLEISLFSSVSNSLLAPSDEFRNQSMNMSPLTEKSLIAQVSSNYGRPSFVLSSSVFSSIGVRDIRY